MPRRRRRDDRQAIGTGGFDESKHRRGQPGNQGQFAKEDGTAKPLAGRKTSGIARDDEILDLRGEASRSLGRVGDFVDVHSGGREAAKTTLRRLFLEGRIGFRAGRPATQTAPVEREPWPGRSERRDLSEDKVQINRDVLKAGLFRDEAHAREITGLLTAGVPPEERLRIRWSRDGFAKTLTMNAVSRNGAIVEREFYPLGQGAWAVEHAYFELPARYQGGGNAKRMMRAAVEAYDDLGVNRIDVHAGLSGGGYAWARAGFVPTDPSAVRSMIKVRTGDLPAAQGRAIRSILDRSGDDDVLFNVAAASVSDRPNLGRDFLRGSDWYGHIDLTDRTHRSRLARYVGT